MSQFPDQSFLENASDSEELAIEWQPYPFEDFQRHFKDVMARRMERTDGDEGAFVRNVLRLKRYFDELYEEPHSIRNYTSFTLAITHLSEFSEEYDSELFGISDNDSLWVSEGLLRAAHWYFAILPRSEWGTNDESLFRIKEWARKWIAENNQNGGGESSSAAPYAPR